MAQQGIQYNIGITGIAEAAARIQRFTAALHRGMRPLALPVGGVLAGLRGIEHGALRTLRAFTGLHSQLLALTGGIGIGFIARQSFAAASGMETLNSQFYTLLRSRDAAKAMMGDLMAFADATPFTPAEVAGGGASLLGAGFDPGSVKDLLRDVGDLAAGAQKPLDQAANIFGRLNASSFGEAFEALRSSFLISKADLEGAGLKFDPSGSYSGSARDAIEAVRQTIRTKFGGAMEEQSKTWAGKMSTLRGYVQKLWAALGAPIQDSLKPWLDRAIVTIKEMSASAADLGRNLARGIETGLNIIQSGNAGEALELSLSIASRRAGAALSAVIQAALESVFSKDFVTASLASIQSLGYSLTAILLEAFAKPIAYFQARIESAMEMVSNPEIGKLKTEKAFHERVRHQAQKAIEYYEGKDNLWANRRRVVSQNRVERSSAALEKIDARLAEISAGDTSAREKEILEGGVRIATPDGIKSAADLRADAEKSGEAASDLWKKIGEKGAKRVQKLINEKITADPKIAEDQSRLDKIIASNRPGPKENTPVQEESPVANRPVSLADALSQGLRRTEPDRLAQIGGFVGASSTTRPLEDTAKATAETAKHTRKIAEYVSKPPLKENGTF